MSRESPGWQGLPRASLELHFGFPELPGTLWDQPRLSRSILKLQETSRKHLKGEGGTSRFRRIMAVLLSCLVVLLSSLVVLFNGLVLQSGLVVLLPGLLVLLLLPGLLVLLSSLVVLLPALLVLLPGLEVLQPSLAR